MEFTFNISNKTNQENREIQASSSEFKKGTAFIGLGFLFNWQKPSIHLYNNYLFIVLSEAWDPEDEPEVTEHDGPISLTLLEMDLTGKEKVPRVVKVHPKNSIYVREFVNANISIVINSCYA